MASFLTRLRMLVSPVAHAPIQAERSASIAKERLQIILSHQRGLQALDGVDVQNLQRDLLAVIQVLGLFRSGA